uniref:C2H2-type domain-containing protein n=1 Tax=Macaca fascicularis TaxID=9541 RepID=A0A7N9CDG4_MACFA
MPRSFLVKKIKGDGFQCSGVPAPTYHPLETAYVLPGARGPPGDNGYAPHCLPPSSYDADQKPGLELAPAEPAYPPAAPEEYSDPESPQSSLSARYFRGEAAVTDSYSMDAFFISDGRSRRRQGGGGGDAGARGRGGAGGRAGRAGAQAGGGHRHACAECGKTYATSSNLSRHKQTHRSLDSQLARKCPTCGKAYVSMPALAMHVLTHNLRHKCGVCGKVSRGPGCCRATCARTLARSRSAARTAARPSPTAPTCARTCRRIRPSSTTAAASATRASRSSPTSTSTARQPASRGPSRPRRPLLARPAEPSASPARLELALHAPRVRYLRPQRPRPPPAFPCPCPSREDP